MIMQAKDIEYDTVQGLTILFTTVCIVDEYSAT